MSMQQVECTECKRMIAMPQLGNHMRSMHPKAEPPPLRALPKVELDDDGMQWEDPPVSARAGLEAALVPLVAKLQRHPERWARMRTYKGPTSANTQVKKARDRFPDCEWRAAKVDGGSALWARFIGDAS